MPRSITPQDYVPVKYRDRFHQVLSKMLEPLNSEGKMKWSHLFRHKALMQAMDEIDRESRRAPVTFKPEPGRMFGTIE